MDIDEKRTKYGEGEWLAEPDHVEFRHAGFVCLIHRNNMGALCGYVGVPPGHPWHGKSDSDVHRMCDDIAVNGGLTYANECAPPLCHVPEPGEPEHLWWIGFDCSHAYDVSPSMAKFDRDRGRDRTPSSCGVTYKNVAYVTSDTRGLAECARDAVSTQPPEAASQA
jgi:hypothetical protein